MKQSRALSSVFVIYTLPAFVLWVALLLTLSFLVLILSMLLGFRMGEALLHPNPFAPYEALWPGLPAASVATYARQTPKGLITCITSGIPPVSYALVKAIDMPGQNDTCMDTPTDGVFQAINILIDNDRIQALRLFSNNLQEEALLLYWGAPDAITQTGDEARVELSWSRSTYTASATLEMSDSVVQVLTVIAK